MSATATAARPVVHTYAIDPAHSEVTFQVRHLLTKVRGSFSLFTGGLEFDAADPTRSSVRVVIDASSIDTHQPDRDKHLRSADFFSVDEFPTLTFESTDVTPVAGGFDVAGTLTIRGVSRQVVIPARALGEATDPWGNRRLAFEADLTINRKDYGLNWNAALETGGFLVGDEVKISLSIQAVQQQTA